MGEYSGYVIAAYAIATSVIAGLVVTLWLERRAARRALERAERALSRGSAK